MRPQTKEKRNNHKYVKLSPCKCGNTKFKYIKLFDRFECSRCKTSRGK